MSHSDTPPPQKQSRRFDWGGVFVFVVSYMAFFVVFVLLLFLVFEFWPRVFHHSGSVSL